MNIQLGSDREQENPSPSVSSTMAPLQNGHYWNMQQLSPPPYGYGDLYTSYYFNEQLELSEQQFSSLWSWQN